MPSRLRPSVVLRSCVLLAACGDDGSSGSGTEASTSQTTAASSDAGQDGLTDDDGSSGPSASTGVAPGTTTGDTTSDDASTGGEVPACDPPAFPPPSIEDDGYQRFELCGWPIYMRIELFESELGDDVYDALAEDLQIVLGLLPEPAIDELRSTNFWMEVNVPAFPGGVYHPSAQWLQDNGYPPKWAEGIQFGNANNYLTWIEQQPAVVLHELTHAWDHQHHGYAHPGILAAYEQAMAAGLYDAVAYVDGQILEAYATTNAAEYFAELTEAYFWTNDFYPFVRAELELHDPVGYAAIEDAWELP